MNESRESQMLNSFHVENYKCLRDVTIPLTPIHVLIGQNDAGKSSLLEAIYAFFRSSRMPLPEAFSGHWLGDDLVYENATDSCVTIEGNWSKFGSYGLKVEFARSEQRRCSNAEEWHESLHSTRKAIPHAATAPYSAIQRWQTHPQQFSDEDAELAREVSSLLSGAHLYSLDPKLMGIPSYLSRERRFRLDPDGFGLPGLLDDILGYDLELFRKIRSEFCRYFPQFRSVRVETEEAIRREYHETGRHRTNEMTGKGIHFETQSGKSIRAQQASDGAILFLGFLALANLPKPPRMLLIEEPETGIYPERLGEVIELLRTMTAEAGETAPQIVFTTHSPYVLSFFQPEEVTLLSRTDDGAVRARPLRDAPHIRERLDGFYLGELWYNLSEEELFADA